MNDRRSRVRLGVLLGLYLVILGGLLGVAAERVRFDRQRGTVLARYDAAARAHHAALMNIELGTDAHGRARGLEAAATGSGRMRAEP